MHVGLDARPPIDITLRRVQLTCVVVVANADEISVCAVDIVGPDGDPLGGDKWGTGNELKRPGVNKHMVISAVVGTDIAAERPANVGGVSRLQWRRCRNSTATTER